MSGSLLPSRRARWTPTFTQALRLALRPLIAYFLLAAGGFVAFTGTVISHNPRDALQVTICAAAGMLGMLIGLGLSITRLRTLPVIIAGGLAMFFAVFVMISGLSRLRVPETAALAFVFFCFGFPGGLLALQHRWELLASFWPAIGWIGSAIMILNHEGRVDDWQEDKSSVWLPVPLFFLGAFLLLWLFYLAAKQAMRITLWEALSGAAARRVSRSTSTSNVSAVPRRNVLPLLVAALLLFGVVAVLSPYLWRTGRGDREGGTGEMEQQEAGEPLRTDGLEGLIEQLKKIASDGADAALSLWPLLFLLLLYRPVKRVILSSHLVTPIIPTPPTERVDNAWEYVRIAAEDAGVVPLASDSVEQLLTRAKERGLGGAHLAAAAAIYTRTRYGFTVAPGDAIAMRTHAIEAARELRVELGGAQRVKNWWRGLS